MPVHPSEEEAPEDITEKVAKDPAQTEATASDHERHQNEHTHGLATVQDHQSKGPQIPVNMSDMPPAASKEEMKQRVAELNQD